MPSAVPHTLFRFAILLTALMICGHPSIAADFTLPANQYDRVDFQYSQCLECDQRARQIEETVFVYEPLDKRPFSYKFRKIGRPVGRLTFTVSKNGNIITSSCTATAITDSYLMTNFHCIPGPTRNQERVLEAHLRFNYLRLKQKDTGRIDVDLDPDKVPYSNKDLDVSILRFIGTFAGETLGRGVKIRAPDPKEGVYIIHHPFGLPKKLTRANCQVVDLDTGNNEFEHSCATSDGSSGALVFAENDDALIGLHNATISPGDVTTDNFAVRMVAIAREIQRTNPSLHKELFGAGERTSDCLNDWRRIRKSYDEKSLRRFLQVCSQSQFAGLAQLRFDYCQYATLLETELWKQVVRQNEFAQYDVFLTCYPSGDFSDLARLKRTSSK